MSCAGAMAAFRRIRPPMILQRRPIAYMIQRQGRRRFFFVQLAHEKLRPLNHAIASMVRNGWSSAYDGYCRLLTNFTVEKEIKAPIVLGRFILVWRQLGLPMYVPSKMIIDPI